MITIRFIFLLLSATITTSIGALSLEKIFAKDSDVKTRILASLVALIGFVFGLLIFTLMLKTLPM